LRVAGKTSGEVEESEDGVADVVLCTEGVRELVTNLEGSFGSSIGDNSEGIGNGSVVVVVGLVGPNVLGGSIVVNNIEDVLFVDLVSFVVSNVHAEGPGTCMIALTGDETLLVVD
jgi:hypothetical protein